MTRYTPLTETERRAHEMRENEKRCNVCANRGVYAWGMWACKIGKCWPEFGRCRSFSDIKQGAKLETPMADR